MTQRRLPAHRPGPSQAPSCPLTTLALLAASSCLVAASAHAQEAALPEVKVTHSANPPATEGTGQYTTRQLSVGKMDQAPREIPRSVSVITRQQLDDRNVTKVEDAVKFSTGINVILAP